MHLPYHESDHVLTLAYSVLTGGTRLEDVDRLRNDVPLMNGLGARLLPDPTTTGDFLRRFTEADIVALMDAINSVRPALWRGRGAGLLGEVAYLDVDGTIVPTMGELKQGMDISYKGIWGYAPLLVTLANTREVLYLVNRPGNAPSHLDAATWIDRAVDLVAPYAQRVCVRGDTDFSLTTNFDQWAQRVDFVLGTGTTNVQAKVRDVLRKIETELKGETMSGVLALVSPEFFDKLIGHAKVEDAYKYFSSTGAQPLREDTRRRFPFAGIVFEEYNATVTLSTGATETLVAAGEGVAFPIGTLDTFVTYGAPANLIETVNSIGLPMYARQLARPDGSAIEVKTEASILPVNKRPRLAVKIHSSN